MPKIKQLSNEELIALRRKEFLKMDYFRIYRKLHSVTDKMRDVLPKGLYFSRHDSAEGEIQNLLFIAIGAIQAAEHIAMKARDIKTYGHPFSWEEQQRSNPFKHYEERKAKRLAKEKKP